MFNRDFFTVNSQPPFQISGYSTSSVQISIVQIFTFQVLVGIHSGVYWVYIWYREMICKSPLLDISMDGCKIRRALGKKKIIIKKSFSNVYNFLYIFHTSIEYIQIVKPELGTDVEKCQLKTKLNWSEEKKGAVLINNRYF